MPENVLDFDRLGSLESLRIQWAFPKYSFHAKPSLLANEILITDLFPMLFFFLPQLWFHAEILPDICCRVIDPRWFAAISILSCLWTCSCANPCTPQYYTWRRWRMDMLKREEFVVWKDTYRWTRSKILHQCILQNYYANLLTVENNKWQIRQEAMRVLKVL